MRRCIIPIFVVPYVQNSNKTFGILCLSSAVGLFLYWTMSLIGVFLRIARFGLDMPEVNTSTGIIGAVCVALFALGIISVKAESIFSVKAKPARALVLVRNTQGKVASILGAEYAHVANGKDVTADHKAKSDLQEPRPRKKGKVKYVLGIAILISLVSGYVLTALATGYTVQDLATGTYAPVMVVASQSMQPVLNGGDLIFVRKEQFENIEPGDIIAFNVPSPYDKLASSPTVHRVVEKWTENGESYFKTRGDNNSGADLWNIPAKNVIGEYTHVKIPYIGFVLVFLRSSLGLASVTLTLALSTFYDYYKKRRNHKS